MGNEVVFCRGGYAIIKSIRPFSTGYNCYEEDENVADKFYKINGEGSWFTTIEAAKDWLHKYKSESHATQ